MGAEWGGRGRAARAVWYSCAMNRKGLVRFALLLAISQGAGAAVGHATQDPGGAGQATPSTTARPSTTPKPFANRSASSSALPKTAGSPAAGVIETGPPNYPAPQITIATPAPAPAPWPWQDRIAWAANLVLVVLGYAGILLALSILKKIEGQMQYAETAALAAQESAQTALHHAQAIERAERPWILVTIEPSRRVENRFMIAATNRGRGPARILSSVDKITIEPDQSSLPDDPSYERAEPNLSLASVILLPGESTAIKIFGREDVRELCRTEERLKRVERWEEVILLYGQIVYEDLIGAGGSQHETSWCCWYIHGQQESGMEMAGPPSYHRHT